VKRGKGKEREKKKKPLLSLQERGEKKIAAIQRGLTCEWSEEKRTGKVRISEGRKEKKGGEGTNLPARGGKLKAKWGGKKKKKKELPSKSERSAELLVWPERQTASRGEKRKGKKSFSSLQKGWKKKEDYGITFPRGRHKPDQFLGREVKKRKKKP